MKADIVYGFQVNNTSPDIVACEGRSQPSGCYTIEIFFPDFLNDSLTATQPGHSDPLINLVFSGMLVLLGITFLIGRLGILKRAPAKNRGHSILMTSAPELAPLGKFLFDAANRRLLLEGAVISLTDKECRVLELLHENFGDLISRETLMQRVWINEGVITSRSLDMFISKLRKKISLDPGLRITNVHGKGYKLETVAP